MQTRFNGKSGPIFWHLLETWVERLTPLRYPLSFTRRRRPLRWTENPTAEKWTTTAQGIVEIWFVIYIYGHSAHITTCARSLGCCWALNQGACVVIAVEWVASSTRRGNKKIVAIMGCRTGWLAEGGQEAMFIMYLGKQKLPATPDW